MKVAATLAGSPAYKWWVLAVVQGSFLLIGLEATTPIAAWIEASAHANIFSE